MKNAFSATALAATLGLAASLSHAQLVRQQFGRDSVYAVPGTTQAQRPSEPVAADAPKLQPFGRDSVYATQRKTPTTPVAADATGLQLYGRDSVYAGPSQQPVTADTRTAARAPSPKAHGG